MLKIKFRQFNNTVFMEVLEQSSEDYERLAFTFVASNGFKLKSVAYPEIINENYIWVRGKKYSYKDNEVVTWNFETEEEAEIFILRAKSAIKYYNDKMKKYKRKRRS